LENGSVLIWDLDANDAPQVTLPAAGQRVFSVAFSRDGRFLVSALSESIHVWNVQTGEEVSYHERMLDDEEGDREELEHEKDEDEEGEEESYITGQAGDATLE
jgi:WD40 repeat protein